MENFVYGFSDSCKILVVHIIDANIYLKLNLLTIIRSHEIVPYVKIDDFCMLKPYKRS